MIILNKELVSTDEAVIPFNNRGTYYGDGIFETLRCYQNEVMFLEEHYFRLMSGMRILRMEIPSFFTPEYFAEQTQRLLDVHQLKDHARLRISVWRVAEGFYTPTNQSVGFSMQVSTLEGPYTNDRPKLIELFKDHYIYAQLLSSIKSTNKAVNILAGIYASENDYDDMLLMNEKKMIVEAISGNLFLVKDKVIKTPPIQDGCLDGIMREKVINQIKKMLNYEVVEETITPFELQRADELFTTNVIQGIQSVGQYRKKEYNKETADELLSLINDGLFK
ncbi:aminotransferase class IV [Nonlabens xiamenensis]|uniref:aminotransferase class IV n=1 Tax=Nonlabens xiamenensis TaxID=2341043 RepID=UPI000F609B02|nr:aminotransferase class IV [Nonlabens xiamenensis]